MKKIIVAIVSALALTGGAIALTGPSLGSGYGGGYGPPTSPPSSTPAPTQTTPPPPQPTSTPTNPYPGTVITDPVVQQPGGVVKPGKKPSKTKPRVIKKRSTVKAGKRHKIRVNISAGNAKATGWVRITIRGKGYKKVIYRKLRNGAATITMPKLKGTKKGRHYKVTITYVPTKNTVFRPSKTAYTLVVKS